MDRKEWDKHVASIPDRLWKRKKKEPAYEDGRRFGAWLGNNEFIFPGYKVLDFGCHYGRIAVGLHDKGVDYVGVDVLTHAIASCKVAFKNCKNMQFIHVDSYNKIYNPTAEGQVELLPVLGNSIDLAIAISVFPHQGNRSEAEFHFAELARTVVDGGEIIVSWNGSPLDNSEREKFFQRDFVMALYKDAGIEVTHEIDNFSLSTVHEYYFRNKKPSPIHAGQTLLIGRKIA